MRLLTKYKALIKNNDLRSKINECQIARIKSKSDFEFREVERLKEEIALLNKLNQVNDLIDVVFDRQKLFDWLRKSAGEKYKTQEIRLELSKQEERLRKSMELVHKHTDTHRYLEYKSKKYQILYQLEKKQLKVKSLNTNEAEIEECQSWLK